MKKEAFYSATEIGTIDLTRLKKNVHGEFHNDVLERAEENAAIRQYLGTQLAAYKAAVEAETRADFVEVEPPLTEDLTALVSSRDKVQTGFKSGARAMMEMDDVEVREAATVLFELTHKHGLHTNMNMDAQTDAIRDFITDVKTNHLGLLAVVGLTTLFNKLDEINERVCDLQKDRFVEEAERQRGVFAEARKATDAAYKELVRGVTAYAFVQGPDAYAPFIAFLNSIIIYIYYRRVHLKEKVDTSGEGGVTEEPTEGTDEGNESSPSTPNTPSSPSEPNTPSTPNKYTVTWFGTDGTPIIWYELDAGNIIPDAPTPPEGYQWPHTPMVMPSRNLEIRPEPIEG